MLIHHMIEYIGGPFDGDFADTSTWSPWANVAYHVRDGHNYRGVNDGERWWFFYDGEALRVR